MRTTGLAAVLALGVLAVLGALAAPSGARTTQTARSTGSDPYFTLSMTGPTSVAYTPGVAPPRQEFDVTLTYIGPAFQPGDPDIDATITVQLSQQEENFGIGCCLPPADCSNSTSSVGTPAPTWSCQFHVGAQTGATQWTFPIGARPTGAIGTGALTVSLSTGASASVTTTYYYAQTTTVDTTTTTDTTPAPAPVVAAAPPATTTTTFTPDTPAVTESTSVAPTADTVSVGVSWPTPADSFDVTNVAIVNGGHVVARATQSVRKLIVVKTRTKTSVKVTIKNPVRGKLTFKLVPRKVTKTTRVKTTVRQTKKR